MDRLLKIAEVQELTRLSRSTIYKKVAEGVLPAPVRLSLRCSRWRESELQAAIEALPRSTELCHKGGAKSALHTRQVNAGRQLNGHQHP